MSEIKTQDKPPDALPVWETMSHDELKVCCESQFNRIEGGMRENIGLRRYLGALVEATTRLSSDLGNGRLCWCRISPANPNDISAHSAECLRIQGLISALTGNEGSLVN